MQREQRSMRSSWLCVRRSHHDEVLLLAVGHREQRKRIAR
jgi:hypothetical protein